MSHTVHDFDHNRMRQVARTRVYGESSGESADGQEATDAVDTRRGTSAAADAHPGAQLNDELEGLFRQWYPYFLPKVRAEVCAAA